MKTVYVETSIISYLAGRPTRDLVIAAHQEITREWWAKKRSQFLIFISQLVVEEAKRGDADAAARRMEVLSGLPMLAATDESLRLAQALIKPGALPTVAQDDAAHIALAAVHGMDYLLTWNCRHLDNAETKPLVRSVCAIEGYKCAEICTPEELMGEIT